MLALWPPRTSLVHTYVPLLAKPTPTNLEWSALFFSLSLLSVYGNQSAN